LIRRARREHRGNVPTNKHHHQPIRHDTYAQVRPHATRQPDGRQTAEAAFTPRGPAYLSHSVMCRSLGVCHLAVTWRCCRIWLYGIKSAVSGGAPHLPTRARLAAGPNRDTARGPCGPCSVAAVPDGQRHTVGVPPQAPSARKLHHLPAPVTDKPRGSTPSPAGPIIFTVAPPHLGPPAYRAVPGGRSSWSGAWQPWQVVAVLTRERMRARTGKRHRNSVRGAGGN
jgi:hypothetical protein